MSRLAGLAAVCLASSLAVSCTGWNMRTAEEERNLSATLGSGRAIRVETVNGSVTIVADSTVSDVAIKAQVRGSAHTEEEARARLADIAVVAENVDGGDLAISLVFSDGEPRNNEGCDLEIRTPGAQGVTVSTGNGEVRIEGLSGVADLRTSNGPITVARHDGAVRADTSNGPIDVQGVIGDADLSTSNGGVVVRGARSRVTAKTSNGDIEFRAANGFSSAFELDTSNGDVDVFLPPSASVDVNSSTSNGSVRAVGGAEVTGDKTDKRICLGKSAPPSRIDTSNGTIIVAVEAIEAEKPH